MLDWLFGRKKQQPLQKPKKSQKEQEAEDKWMYDFIVQFLSSPIWRVSLLDFVDNKCIVFDNEEQNKFEYTVIHNEFKELVGTLVDGMMEQIGMSQQKLAEIIEKGFESKQRKLFNQLLLADDFLRFKDLMVKRNKALEQQALKALQESQIKSSNKQQKPIKNESQEQLIRESQRLQQERQRKIQEEEEQMLRKAIEMSQISSKQSQAIRSLQQKATDRIQQETKKQEKNQQKQKDKITQTSVQKKTSKLQSLKSSLPAVKDSKVSELPPLRGTLNKNLKFQEQFPMKNIQKIEQPQRQNKEVEQIPTFVEKVQEKTQVQSMQDRKQRLLAQRQKIRKQKQEERKKQLEAQTQEKEKITQSEVHTIVLQQDGFYDQNVVKKQVVPVGQNNAVSEEELRRRRELMNKIKNRIIDDL